MKLLASLLALWLCLATPSFAVRHANLTRLVLGSHSDAAATFTGWYDAYNTGKGIWKWHNALQAYQTHFARFQTNTVKFSLVEIGVQSGGSIKMFQEVLGPNCHYYGCDINPKCNNFANPLATITIMDQGDANQWTNFYAKVVPMVDMIVDDGGHQPYQMLVTLQQSFAHLNAGGVHLIEDIHGVNGDYMQGLFNPAGDMLGASVSHVAAVHLYPFVMVVQKSGGTYVQPSPTTPAATFDSVEALVGATPQHLGKVLHLKNPAWPSLLTAVGLKSLFLAFYELHGGKVTPHPPNCFEDAIATPDCTMYVTNTALQNLVTSVNIYPGHAEVFVAAAPPSIYATRRGTEWIPYSG